MIQTCLIVADGATVVSIGICVNCYITTAFVKVLSRELEEFAKFMLKSSPL